MSTQQTERLSLSAAMREGSMAEHEAAEGSSFMGELLAGRVAEEGYAAYLLRLRAVYAALEAVGRAHRDDPFVAAVHDADLERLATIDADLEHWLDEHRLDEHRLEGRPGTDGSRGESPRTLTSPAAAAYVARVEAAAEWGGLFAAHHYTRYLGDLSGGQAIGRILDRTFSLDGAGTAFYRFEAIPKPKTYKDAYRARLDGLGATPEQVDRIVAEVKVAFGLNQALFDELGAELPRWQRTPSPS